MTITIQHGCSTAGLKDAIFQTFTRGRVQAHEERQTFADRLKRLDGEKYLPVSAGPVQVGLFGEEG